MPLQAALHRCASLACRRQGKRDNGMHGKAALELLVDDPRSRCNAGLVTFPRAARSLSFYDCGVLASLGTRESGF